MIYLDNAATTFPKPENVYKAMDKANRELAFNAGRGSYKVAREVTKLIDDTKYHLLKLLHAPPSAKVYFSPSITIALNQILNGIELIEGDNIYISPYEHNAVVRTLYTIQRHKNINIIHLPLKENLSIDLEKMNYMFLRHRPKCICCTHISNITGYILPIKDIFTLAKQYDAITILDSAQSLGLIETNASQLNADYIAFAGHKSLYGPLGIGGIIEFKRKMNNIYLSGGTGSDSLNPDMQTLSEHKYEPASQNVVAIAGLHTALKELDVTAIYNHEKKLTEDLLNRLFAIDRLIVYSPPSDTHIGIVSFNIEGYSCNDVGLILDADFDIAVRTGYHCTPYIHDFLDDKTSLGTVRISLGRYSTIEEIHHLVNAIEEIS